MQKHFPDLLVIGDGWQSMWEIKPRWYATQPDVTQRTEFLRQALPGHGFDYHLVHAENLIVSPRYENAKHLLTMGRTPVSQFDQEKIRNQFQDDSTLLWGDLKLHAEMSRLPHQICRLVLEGHVHLDINKPINNETVIAWAHKQPIIGG